MNKVNGIILALGLMAALCGTASATQLYVNENGWWRDGGAFNTSSTPIQSAVNAAAVGDAIYVYNGSYTENVNVNERLTLEGEGADVVTVTAADSGDHVFEVADVNYVNISGFALRGATDSDMSGIYLENANYCNISENNVYGNSYGIHMSSSSSNTLTDNTVNSNRKGICLDGSCNNTLEHNTANLHWCGICMQRSSNSNTLTNNTANLNDNWGICLWHSSNNNTLENNTVNSNNWYGIHMSSSSNNMLTDNTVNSNTYQGITIDDSCNNTLTDNNASNNTRGIYLERSSNNMLVKNIANSNSKFGIFLSNADNNNITCNWVQGNGQGFYLTSGSTGNNISYNNIIENGNYNTASGSWEWQFYMDQYNPVEAKHNYWGAGMNNDTIDASIYDDEEGWGEVKFHPFATGPVPCAPIPELPTVVLFAVGLIMLAGYTRRR